MFPLQLQGTELLVEEGVRSEITCQAQGRPQPEVMIMYLYDDDDDIDDDDVVVDDADDDDDGDDDDDQYADSQKNDFR